jgi:septum formation protein
MMDQTQPEIILASASPRRKELLAQAGFVFRVVTSGVPEVREPGESPISFVTRLAREKAQDVASRSPQSCVILGADTVVVCDEQVLGKPMDTDDARRMLRLLAGRTHRVITGVCVLSGNVVESAVEVTMVQMLTMSAKEIEDYVQSGEPMDKAGGYAIQGRAARWIPRIQGCYFNVVGLPLAVTAAMLETALVTGKQPSEKAIQF